MLDVTAPRNNIVAAPGSPPQIKICGITQEGHASGAALLGADMIGLVFAPSRRRVSLEQAARIISCLHSRGRWPMTVGLFVNEPYVSIIETADNLGLDIIQLSGDETPKEVGAVALHYPVIKAVRFEPGVPISAALDTCRSYMRSAPEGRIQLLIDAYHPGAYGGTGKVADWELAAKLAAHFPIFIAGGLNPANVGKAIARISPIGVDVSSGVESNGTKDIWRIAEFMRAAKRNTVNERTFR